MTLFLVSPVSPSTEERLHDGGDAACGPFWFCVLLVFLLFVVRVFFSTIRLTFPPFNDDLGTMPTRRPYSWDTGVWLDWDPNISYELVGGQANKAIRIPANPRGEIADRAFYAAPVLRHVEVAVGI